MNRVWCMISCLVCIHEGCFLFLQVMQESGSGSDDDLGDGAG